MEGDHLTFMPVYAPFWIQTHDLMRGILLLFDTLEGKIHDDLSLE